jgi:hypothetical protein
MAARSATSRSQSDYDFRRSSSPYAIAFAVRSRFSGLRSASDTDRSKTPAGFSSLGHDDK